MLAVEVHCLFFVSMAPNLLRVFILLTVCLLRLKPICLSFIGYKLEVQPDVTKLMAYVQKQRLHCKKQELTIPNDFGLRKVKKGRVLR